MIGQAFPRETQAGTGGDDATLDQQRDHLCAAFHGARILHDAGFAEFEGIPVDLRLVEPDRAGTAPGGLAEAIVSLSGGRLECVPMRGGWSAAVVEGLLDRAPSVGARLIANIRTGFLWVSRPPIEAGLAQLAGAEPHEVPRSEWDVGHFVELVALVRGPAGALVVVRDSYPSLGWNAHHLQPPELLARALTRDDGREGGVLAVVARGTGEAVGRMAKELTLETELWDTRTEVAD